MNLVIQNASINFAKALKAMAKIDGATVKVQKQKTSPILQALNEVENGETEKYATLEDFKKEMEM